MSILEIKEKKMDLIEMLFSDPVALYSAIGLLILLGIGAFYIYYFISHILADK